MNVTPKAIVGCLLDVSGSMREALEVGRHDHNTPDRFQVVLRAALKLARAEQRHAPDALMFVGAFGLNAKSPPVVDLCSVLDSLVDSVNGDKTGHQLLCGLANDNNVEHITKYIYEKLTDDESRIIYGFFRRHPERINPFVAAIPSSSETDTLRYGARGGAAIALGALGVLGGSVGILVGTGIGLALGNKAGAVVENEVVEKSKALKLARQICDEWLLDFVDLVPRPLNDVVRLLENVQQQDDRRKRATQVRIQESESYQTGRKRKAGKESVLDTIRGYIYGWTPLKAALEKTLVVFRRYPSVQHRVLVTISDGKSTDGDPLPVASDLRKYDVDMATIYLTSKEEANNRQLHYKAADHWDSGQQVLFEMATKISCANHPIPVLASMGWKIPSPGQAGLYATVSSSAVLEEFCSQLLSARFGSADALLNMIGQVEQDKFINDSHVRTCKNPSDQGNSATCYAHAIAAVIHMALLRIVDREGGVPSIVEIRERILTKFPPTKTGRISEEVLKTIMQLQWYRPLHYREVDEDGARQAVLHRRPILATFALSAAGWEKFSAHFQDQGSCNNVLTSADMAAHRLPPGAGGHAVVLSGCDPSSLTFLNSWGSTWGNKGSFAISNPPVLEMSGPSEYARMRFYDVSWYESDLTDKEREAYETRAFDTLRDRANRYPSILEFDARCPHCLHNSPISKFSGNSRQIICPQPNCGKAFLPEPGVLVKALYSSSGLDDPVYNS